VSATRFAPRAKSAAVGIASAGLDAGLFALCTLVWTGGLALVAARWLCAAASAVGNFAGNRIFAFGSEGRLTRQLGRYALAALTGISLTTASWWALARATGWDPRLVHLASLVLVWGLFTFPVLRRWVFPTPAE